MHCEICGKTSTFGKKVAHNRMYVAGRTNRKIKPNLQRGIIDTPYGGKRVTMCTRCMRTLRKS
ncbi:MAG: 50S ribosomal protein L28 [Clostridia bacterium]|nr:50S ribosomal protein L28 [Clostridia bacterium]